MANGLLGLIAQPQIADIQGGFARGRQEAQTQQELQRQQQARGLAGAALQQQFGGQLGELAAVDPALAQQVFQSQQVVGQARQKQFTEDVRVAANLAQTDPLQARGFIEQAIQRNELQGIPSPQMRQFLTEFDQDPARGSQTLQQLNQALTPTTAGKPFQKGATFQVQTPEGPAIATNIIDPIRGTQQVVITPLGAGIVPTSRLGETVGEQETRLRREAREQAAAKATGTGISTRQQVFIDTGVEAADATAITRRGLELIDQVATGGIDAVSLRAKQIFGVEGADEAELSTNLGKAVLSQLRATFGAAFTANEGAQLQRIEAGFGKSTAGNKRLLNQALKLSERAARRGLSAAKSAGDTFTANEIEEALKFSVTPLSETPAAAPTQQQVTPAAPVQQQPVIRFDRQGRRIQ